jgi:hypothetical protein
MTERDAKPANLFLVASGKLVPWSPETTASAQEVLAELLEHYEQVLLFGIKRGAERTHCTETNYLYMHRLARTSRDEFMGAIRRKLHQALELDQEEDDVEPGS